MPVIPTTDGKLIEVEEGTLRPPPKAPKVKKTGNYKGNKLKGEKKSKPRPKNLTKRGMRLSRERSGDRSGLRRKHLEVVGFKEWMARRASELIAVLPKNTVGRKVGQPDGMLIEQAEEAWAIARAKAKEDMANIKKVMDIGDERAEEALLATIEVMRSPMNQATKLQAARQVLEWTKAKPANKSEVTVNAAEAWLASIAEDAKDDE